LNFAELADGLRYWLDEHPARGPFETEGYAALPFEPFDDLAQLIQFAVRADLIEISPGGLLSFRHELLAEYFVAEYFYAADASSGPPQCLSVGHSYVKLPPGAIPSPLWAGLLDDPLELAERFGPTVLPIHPRIPGVGLALVCIGVAWILPEDGTTSNVVLPIALQKPWLPWSKASQHV